MNLLYVLLLLHISEYYVPLMFILSILNLFYCVVLLFSVIVLL